MKNHLLFTLLVCLCYLNLFGQTDTTTTIPDSTLNIEQPIETVETVTMSAYKLDARDGQLIFTSEGLNGQAAININGEDQELIFANGQAGVAVDADVKGKLLLLTTVNNKHKLYHIARHNDGTYRLRHIPLWLSIIPPLVAIFLALIFKEVVISLFLGVWAGAFIAGGMRIGSLYYFILSFLEVVQKYVINALADSGHLSIIVFSLMIGGMVAIISRNGGMAGIVKELSRFAKSTRSSQFITWLLGVAIFFDDYANTLIVGNTMRSVTDRFRISREKLAYIVDSTAAPVSAVAFITTWIGAELGYIDDGISGLAGFDANMTPYAIFINSLKYSFYPILTLCFILMLIYTQRDYGSMYAAEKRARETGEVAPKTASATAEGDVEDLDPVPGAPLKWYNAFFPVILVIFMTIFGLIDTGMANCYAELLANGHAVASQSWGDVWGAMAFLLEGETPSFFMKIGKLIGNADSYIALLWASMSGVALAAIMTMYGRIMNLADTIGTMTTGFKAMLPALLILTLAWSLAITTEELHTATFLTSNLAESLHPYLMPVITFILAALISFSTGSSWSTMAILYPIAIPTTWAICQAQGFTGDVGMEILFNVISIVLAASVLGDHCSPISDTTILSSLASDCNHIDHVRTQLPYALTVGGVSLGAGFFSTFLGGGWLVTFLLLLISLVILFGIVMRFGKRVD